MNASDTPARTFKLQPDTRGAVWDLLLYVPTVIALASVGAKLWFDGQTALAYLLSFMACFFALVGGNRVLKTRLLWLAAAPVELAVHPDRLEITQRDSNRIGLFKALKLYADIAGRSFGVAGLNAVGERQQLVLHRANFPGDEAFEAAKEAILKLEKRQGASTR